MLANPTNGSSSRLSNLFGLSPALGAAFQPTLASAPSDWTIAISYSSSNTCGGGGHLINSAQDLAVDSIGGVWIANNESNGNLSYLTHTGAPATCVQVGTGALSGITIDYASPLGLPNVWLADSGSSNVFRYHPTDTAATAFATADVPASISADGAGNIYYTTPAGSGTLYEIPGGATAYLLLSPWRPRWCLNRHRDWHPGRKCSLTAPRRFGPRQSEAALHHPFCFCYARCTASGYTSSPPSFATDRHRPLRCLPDLRGDHRRPAAGGTKSSVFVLVRPV